MEIILLVLFLAGLPRSLWCIPAFILMWGLAGGSSGGSSGMGDNIGYWLILPVVFGVAVWGIYSNLRRAAEKSLPINMKQKDQPRPENDHRGGVS